jgi:hypothetical protein
MRPAFEKRLGFCNGALEWQDYRFGNPALDSYEMSRERGMVLILSSPDPAATARGLEKYNSRWNSALQKSLQSICPSGTARQGGARHAVCRFLRGRRYRRSGSAIYHLRDSHRTQIR